MNRKEFFTKVLLGGSVMFIGPAFFEACSNSSLATPSTPSSSNPQTIDLTSASYSSLKNVGGYVYYGNIIIIRTGSSSYVAMSSICTHQGCTVTYSSSAKEVYCPCHGSLFSTKGAVLRGPAYQALTTYKVTVNGNKLTIG